MTKPAARLCALIAPVVVALVVAAPAQAGSRLRYALVVGNDHGEKPGIELTDLAHAEDEAARLRDQLLRYGAFDAERVLLLRGAGREEILAAAAQLASMHARERRDLGDPPTLFTFFFTGHGLAGELLTRDAPLSHEDVAGVFRAMDATMSVGFFDACFAGSLALDEIKAKGAMPTPGFSPARELPDEVLAMEGSVWLASSASGELSYEDEQRGGLFTHYFIDAFANAPADAVGISLQNMWEYARRHTLAHAARYGRQQTPEMLVRHLKARGPLYLSFPEQRVAKLRMSAEVGGTFVLSYEDGALIEKVVKEAGTPLELALYEGRLTITRLGGGAGSIQVDVARGAEVTLGPQALAPRGHTVGFRDSPVHGKGGFGDLALTRTAASPVLTLGAGYAYGLTPAGSLASNHHLTIEGFAVRGPMTLSLSVSGGLADARFESWSVAGRELAVRAHGGYGVEVLGARLDALAWAGPLFTWARYDSGHELTHTHVSFGLSIRASLPVPAAEPWLLFFAQASLGLRSFENVAWADTASSWALAPELYAGLAIPLWRG